MGEPDNSSERRVTTMAQELDEATQRKQLEQTEIGSLLLECGNPPSAAYEFMLRIQQPSEALLRELKQLAGTPEREEVGTINICAQSQVHGGQPSVLAEVIEQIVRHSPKTVD